MHVLKLTIVLLSSLALIGCRSDNYVGKIVPQQNKIALKQGGPHQGIWSSNHMKFRYMYFKTPSQIEFSGKLSLLDIPASVNMESIGFWVHFLDSEGRIIRDRTVYSSNAFWVGEKHTKKSEPTGGDERHGIQLPGKRRQRSRQRRPEVSDDTVSGKLIRPQFLESYTPAQWVNPL
jgi:hypothetical protein